jgi:thioredoxin 1
MRGTWSLGPAQTGPTSAARHFFRSPEALPRMSEHVHHVTDDTFETEVLRSSTPVLVDYWAEWCGPCKMIAPILDELAQDYAGRLKVTKLNVDDNQDTPAKYGIRGIPTLMLFKNGNMEAMKVGALSKSQLTAFIDSNI